MIPRYEHLEVNIDRSNIHLATACHIQPLVPLLHGFHLGIPEEWRVQRLKLVDEFQVQPYEIFFVPDFHILLMCEVDWAMDQ